MIENRDIICISSMNYEEHMTAKQQVMRILAEKNRVFFCQREVGAEHLAKHPQLAAEILKRKNKTPYEKDNIIIIHPPLMLPGRYYSHFINRVNQRRLSRFISGIMKKYNVENPVLWTFQPHSAPLVLNLKPKVKIYHCVENYNVMCSGRKKRIMQEQENELCAISDFVFCATQGVYDKIKKITPGNARLVYNGVDFDLFKKSRNAFPDPADIKNLPRPRLLHMGMINGKVDFDLFIFLASRNPGWQIILAGDIFYSDIDIIKYKKLKRFENVFFTGKKDVETLPAYLSNIDACLIAGKKNEWTKITKPLKSYEYLASGKPVVSIGFPELDSFKNFFYTAENYTDYEENIKKILSGERKTAEEEQIEFASAHSWRARVEQMSGLIEETL